MAPDRLDPAAIAAAKETHDRLQQWAPTVQRLVRARIAALDDAYGRLDYATETSEEFAGRVLAVGQYPFPHGECTYDDLDCNNGYEDIRIGYGEIYFRGSYPKWAEDGESYEMCRASISCPTSLVTDPDGVAQYEAKTAEMVAKVKTDREEEDRRIDEIIREAIADRADGAAHD